MKKRLGALLLTAAMVTTMLAGCGKEDVKETTAAPANNETTTEAAAAPVTLKVFSNLTDRATGQGLVEQKIIDEYMAANKNVTIEVEALPEAEYKAKFSAYSMGDMPDVVSLWGQPSFLDDPVSAGVLADLNEADYADYKFIPGSLEGFKYDGKLYGLPRNTDVAVIYYNEKLFKDNGWKVPTTYDELLALGKTINDSGKKIAPIAIGAGEGWTASIFLSDILYKITGDYSPIIQNAISTGDFSDPSLKQAAQLLKDAAAANLFQKGYDTQDPATAKNLFTNGQAAMLYIGSWESSMATDEAIDKDVRENIRCFTMPVVKDGKATATDVSIWNGGGYGVSAKSANKEEAVKFLNFMYQPDKLSKYGWENGVGMSAQDQSAYLKGDESELQKQILNIVSTATGTSATTINDRGPAAFKESIEKEIQNLMNGKSSVDDFLAAIGKACK